MKMLMLEMLGLGVGLTVIGCLYFKDNPEELKKMKKSVNDMSNMLCDNKKQEG